MEERIDNGENTYFSNAKDKIEAIMEEEKIVLTSIFFEKFLCFLSNLCNYEEEGEKIKPSILLGYEIEDALKVVNSKDIINIFEDDLDGSHFEKRIKALIPFCKSEWKIIIELKEDKICYGAVKSYSGIKGLTINQLVFDDREYGQSTTDVGLISIEVKNSKEIRILSLKGKNLNINFSLIHKVAKDIEKIINVLVTDVISNESFCEEEIGSLRTVYEKLFLYANKKSHGSICLIVKNDIKLPSKELGDGIWLEEPIKLSDFAEDVIKETLNNNIAYEKFNSLVDLFIEMLNIDGMTVIDDKGYIRGYNVFVNQNLNMKSKKAPGGARRRAFNAILDSDNEEYIGAYFQSQDGDVFYERMKKE